MKNKVAAIGFVLMLCLFCLILPQKAKAAVGYADMGDVIQMGDFEGSTHYIVFYPKELESSYDTWPVAVWANGTMCAPVLYTDLLKGIAAKGYVVVASSELMSANGQGQCDAIDYIVDESMDENSVFYCKIDPGKIAAFGHSQGGRSSVNAAVADERISCVVSIAGSSYQAEAKKLSTPTLFLAGTRDVVVLPSLWVEPAYRNCTGPAVMAALDGGIHTSCILNSEKYIGYSTDWFDAWLKADESALNEFKQTGALSKDTNWKNFQAKNISRNMYSGSIFSEGNIWRAVALIELMIIVGFAAVLMTKRKMKKDMARGE